MANPLSFNYATFSGVSDLALVGNSTLTASDLVLVPGVGSQAGAAWHNTQLTSINSSTTFQLHFSWNIGPPENGVCGSNADGFALVLHNDTRSISALGSTGGAVGYSGTGAIAPSWAVIFNIFQNGSEASGNSVFPAVDGSQAEAGGANEISVAFSMTDDTPHFGWLTYASNTMRLYVASDNSQPATPILSLTVTLEQVVGTEAWVGFTAGTGFCYFRHAIKSWEFAGGNAVAQTTLTAVSITSSVAPGRAPVAIPHGFGTTATPGRLGAMPMLRSLTASVALGRPSPLAMPRGVSTSVRTGLAPVVVPRGFASAAAPGRAPIATVRSLTASVALGRPTPLVMPRGIGLSVDLGVPDTFVGASTFNVDSITSSARTGLGLVAIPHGFGAGTGTAGDPPVLAFPQALSAITTAIGKPTLQGGFITAQIPRGDQGAGRYRNWNLLPSVVDVWEANRGDEWRTQRAERAAQAEARRQAQAAAEAAAREQERLEAEAGRQWAAALLAATGAQPVPRGEPQVHSAEEVADALLSLATALRGR